MFYRILFLLSCCLTVSFSAISAQALTLTDIPPALKAQAAPPKPQATSWMLVEQNSGWIITQSNADKKIGPASLSKIMTAYVVFDALANNIIQLDDEVRVSERAWKTGGSRMFLDVNSSVTVEQLIQGLIIQSGNDAAVALAEHVGGDVATFAQLMNQKAAQIGMNASNFTNPHGLTDEQHYSTVRDLMMLTSRMIADFPQYYGWYKQKEYTHNKITQPNRNRLLWLNKNVDGVKTGHTSEAGYCLVASALENDLRLTAIVVGADSDQARVDFVEALLRYGFNYYQYSSVYRSGETITEFPVYKGEQSIVTATVAEDVNLLVPKGGDNLIEAQVTAPHEFIAPLEQAQVVGELSLLYAGEAVQQVPLVAAQAVAQGPLWSRLFDSLILWWQKD